MKTPRKRRFTAKEAAATEARALAMRKAGKKYREIAAELEIAPTSAYYYCNRSRLKSR